MLATLPQCKCNTIRCKNHICHHSLSVCGISKIMHCGILINMPIETLYLQRIRVNSLNLGNLPPPGSISQLAHLKTKQTGREHLWYPNIGIETLPYSPNLFISFCSISEAQVLRFEVPDSMSKSCRLVS